MSFEAFEIILTPTEKSLGQSGDLQKIAEEILMRFPAFQRDDHEGTKASALWFVSETEYGLFQVAVYSDSVSSVRFFMHFAYSNPRSVYAPFCACAAELMETYSLSLQMCAEDAPDMPLPDEITHTDDLCNLLLPAMDYNRFLWQSDMQTTEEIALRPGDAVARFLPAVLIH